MESLQEKAVVAIVRYFERIGYEIVEVGWQCNFGKVDIVANDSGTLVFTKVVAKRLADSGPVVDPLEVSTTERGAFERIASEYLLFLDQPVAMPIRYDKVSVCVVSEDRAFVRHTVGVTSFDEVNHKPMSKLAAYVESKSGHVLLTLRAMTISLALTPAGMVHAVVANGGRKVEQYVDNEHELCELIESTFGDSPIRWCSRCGKPLTEGYTDSEGSFYACEQCLESEMDDAYGEDAWRESPGAAPGRMGGYFQYWEEGWFDTGVFWTAWDD